MKVLKIVFTSIGAIFLTVAILVFLNNKKFMKTAIQADGVVVYAGQTPTIAFTDLNNKRIEYTPNMKCNPPCYNLNEKVKVYYDKNDSNDVMISGFVSQYLLVLIFGILGFIFFSIGFGFIIFGILKKGERENLKKMGIKVETKFVEIKQNTYVRVNRKHPYYIVTEWFDEDKQAKHYFKSENIWVNPKRYIDENADIIVYLDRNNYKKYYVDISFLPKD